MDDKSPISVIDVIMHKNKYSTQTFVVVDRYPEFKYVQANGWLIGEDSGLFSFYYYEKPSEYAEAFAGRKFGVPLANGETIKASGQWWHGIPSDFAGLLYHHGTNTPDRLGKCNVFHSMSIDCVMVDQWIALNDPSNNYNKYDDRHKALGIHTIESPW